MIRFAALAFALALLPVVPARAEEAAAMHTYKSFDGTPIAYQEVGTGPLVVLLLVAHLKEDPYATVGYSMGSISALRWHLLSRNTGRMALGGIGDSGADEFNRDRNTAFRAAIRAAMAGEDTPGARSMLARARATGGTLDGYLGALSARTYTSADLLATFQVPTLILTGDQDLDNGSGPGLAALIPGAAYRQLTGTHLTAVLDPELPRAIIAFLDEGRPAD